MSHVIPNDDFQFEIIYIASGVSLESVFLDKGLPDMR